MEKRTPTRPRFPFPPCWYRVISSFFIGTLSPSLHDNTGVGCDTLVVHMLVAFCLSISYQVKGGNMSLPATAQQPPFRQGR